MTAMVLTWASAPVAPAAARIRLTRGASVERATGASGPAARHLALCLRPTVACTGSKLVRAVVPVARSVTPFVLRQ